ncbi:MAG: RagB/SusD family nutrient uptake outer membrane protein [Bacteroidales bacterium]|nr:RagB/SusD family nutrient uptake outer membrane protein [Bacteroidales bacterium]
MKKFYHILLSATVLLVFAGCNKVLDLGPIDYPATGNFWKEEAQVQTYLNGLMTHFRGDYGSLYVLGEVRGGTLKEGSSIENVSLNYARLILNQLDKDNTGITNWNGYYSRILQVNHYIDQLENACEFLDEASRNKYLAPGYGLRAYYYFMLYRTYGGVPLETTVKLMDGSIDINNLYLARSSAEETLAQIKKDINASEAAYGSDRTLDRNFWNYYATEILKAHIYLWSAKVTTRYSESSGTHTATASNEELTIARTALQNIVNSGKFTLVPFADLYNWNKKGNNELILSLHFDYTETTNDAANYYYQASIWCNSYYDEDGNLLGDPLNLCGGGMHRNEWRESFVKSFDKEDARRAVTFHECYSGTGVFGSAMLKRMGHVDGSTRYSDSDIHVYRYADVLLLLAEVENALGNTENVPAYINQIRERAYGTGYPEYSDGGFAANELAILKERDKEFVAEGSRWFDIIRLQDASKKPLAFSAAAAYPVTYGGTATAVLSNENLLLWPVDVNVLNNDNLITQTVGY